MTRAPGSEDRAARLTEPIEKALQRYAGWTAFSETIRGDVVDAATLATPASVQSTPSGPGASSADAGASPTVEPRGALSGHADLQVERILAEGGMGRVVLARQRSLSREVAVKTVKPDLASSPLSLELRAEGVITGSLEHPNIIPVHALSVGADGQLFLVMKRVDGVAWSALLADPQHPGWERIGVVDGDRLGAHLGILTAVCNAVEFAHRHGVIHRDIKPENVMLGELGDVYLVDWGIATALDPTDARFRKDVLGFVGTPAYVAPEMLGDDGGAIDARTDTYLLGATLHAVLTGSPRHQGTTLMSTLVAAALSDPAEYGPEVPEELGRIANRACARDPADRFPSARALRDAIGEFLRHRSSIVLADDAHARLSRVRALRDGTRAGGSQPDAALDRRQLRQLEIECKYGFARALESWSGNTRAREGLRECALLAARDEIARGDLGAAESTLLEVEDPPADVTTALEALRVEVRAKEQRDARARELERQTDWRSGAVPRVAFFSAFAVVCVGIWLWATEGQLRVHTSLPPERLAAGMGMTLLVSCAAVFIERRRLLTNQVSTRLVQSLLVTVAALFVHRTLSCFPAPPTATVVSDDLLFCAYGAALAAIMLAPWLAQQTPIWLGAAFAARWAPPDAGIFFAVAAALSFLVGAWHLWPRGRGSSDSRSTEPGGDQPSG